MRDKWYQHQLERRTRTKTLQSRVKKVVKPTGATTTEPAERKAVRKNIKNKPLEKVTEKKAPEQHKLTVEDNVDKDAMDNDDAVDALEA